MDPMKNIVTVCRLALSCLLLMFGLLASNSPEVSCLDNGLALTPPMGWLAWERFVCETDCQKYPNECINEQLFLQMARQLVAGGYKDVGYQYVNIDDCWSERERNNQTKALIADQKRFTGASVRYLADEIHSLGLKLGIYGDCGTETCQRFPGQLKYEGNLSGNYFEIDANTFADWHVDSFKFDGCFLDVERAAKICPLMEGYLNRTGRPVLFSCSWPAYENDAKLETNWTLVVEKCNLWRAFGDIEDSWSSVLGTIDFFVAKQELVVEHHGPGHWFDADQLVIGNFGLSYEQEQAHMAIWCIWASPLYMSNDLRSISNRSADILRNKWAISVNQDKLGIFGMMVYEKNQIQVFVKPVEPIRNSCPSYAIVYFNRRTLGNAVIVSIKLSKILSNLEDKFAKLKLHTQWAGCASLSNATFQVNDLLDNNAKLIDELPLLESKLQLRVNLSGVRMVKLVQN